MVKVVASLGEKKEKKKRIFGDFVTREPELKHRSWYDRTDRSQVNPQKVSGCAF
jgi:hypothetical protein